MTTGSLLASAEPKFNSDFANWTSASFTNPNNVTYFCENWFVTAPRGPEADFTLKPLDPKRASGLRVLVRKPPEMVRVWHKLPGKAWGAGKGVARFKIRGEAAESAPPQLDTVAIFRGSDLDRKFVRTLFGPLPLEQSWREMTLQLGAGDSTFDDDRFISFRFSGTGVIEFDFCRLETAEESLEMAVVQGRGWSVAKWLATRVMTRFRDVDPSNAPATIEDSRSTNDGREKPAQAKIGGERRDPLHQIGLGDGDRAVDDFVVGGHGSRVRLPPGRSIGQRTWVRSSSLSFSSTSAFIWSNFSCR